MELDRFLLGLRRSWYVLAAFLLIGIGSAWLYNVMLRTQTAAADVAVLEPSVTRATTSQQAQVTFSGIGESHTLAERVVTRLALDISPDALQSMITVRPLPSQIPTIASPLYRVQVRNTNGAMALYLARAVVDESRLLFTEMNQMTTAALESSFQDILANQRSQRDTAQAQLTGFERANDAVGLPTQVQIQTALVSGLRQADQTGNASQTDSLTVRLRRSAEQEQAELARLQSLLPQYERLTFEVTLAQTDVANLEGRVSALSPNSGGNATAGAEAEQELAVARQRYQEATSQLNAFRSSRDVTALPEMISNQEAIVRQIRLAAALPVSPETLDQVQERLDRLLTLQPEYNRLATDLSDAQSRMTQLQAQILALEVGQTADPSALVKGVDEPHLLSDTLLTIVSYVLGVVLGLFTGLVVVYLLTYFARGPESGREAAELVGAPILAHIPSA